MSILTVMNKKEKRKYLSKAPKTLSWATFSSDCFHKQIVWYNNMCSSWIKFVTKRKSNACKIVLIWQGHTIQYTDNFEIEKKR